MGIAGLIFGILFIVLIAFIVKAIMGKTGMCHYCGDRKEDSAISILKERYAKGEIGKDEFEQKMKDLKSSEPK